MVSSVLTWVLSSLSVRPAASVMALAYASSSWRTATKSAVNSTNLVLVLASTVD